VLGGVQAAGEAAGERLAFDRRDDVVGEPARAPLGLVLQRHQHLLGEVPGPRLHVAIGVAEIEGDLAGGGEGWGRAPFHLTGTLSWLEQLTTRSTCGLRAASASGKADPADSEKERHGDELSER